MRTDAQFGSWWGTFECSRGQRRHFQLGPCKLWFERLQGEWRVTRDVGGDPLDPSLAIAVDGPPPPSPVPGSQAIVAERFATPDEDTQLEIRPRLADRSVVIHTAEPFSLRGDHSATLYVSTAVWVTGRLGQPPRDMFDWPTFRAPDTWFGPNTREGELCYASRTAARMHLADLPPRPGRCITPLRLRNEAADPLVFDRVAIPAPVLSVFGSRDGRLFSESVELTRGADGATAGVSIVDGAPPETSGAELLSEPRAGEERNLLARAFRAFAG